MKDQLYEFNADLDTGAALRRRPAPTGKYIFRQLKYRISKFYTRHHPTIPGKVIISGLSGFSPSQMAYYLRFYLGSKQSMVPMVAILGSNASPDTI
ncbi:MAG: hypothetical protein GY861_10265 [bacterium]|nr:hypothetical protein [bacterium]